MPNPIANVGSPNAVIPVDPYGNTGSVSFYGSLTTSIDPIFLFLDTFDGASLDTTNRWTAGGTVPPTASGLGSVLINPGTAASASSSLSSQFSFQPSGAQIAATFAQFEATTIATGNHRFFGMGTQPGSWTAATPLQDALGFEVDTNGILRTCVYSAGTRIDTTPLNIPKDGFPHILFMQFRAGIAFFCLDNTSQILATSFASPSVQTLPLRFHSINGLATTVGTPTFAGSASAIVDSSRPSTAIADGQFPWRRQKIGANGEIYANNVIATYPSAPTSIVSAAADTALTAANATRRQLIISNDSTSKLYILVDQSGAGAASATNFTYVIQPGGTFEMPNPVSTARIRGFWSAANGTAAVTDISGGTVQGSA